MGSKSVILMVTVQTRRNSLHNFMYKTTAAGKFPLFRGVRCLRKRRRGNSGVGCPQGEVWCEGHVWSHTRLFGELDCGKSRESLLCRPLVIISKTTRKKSPRLASWLTAFPRQYRPQLRWPSLDRSSHTNRTCTRERALGQIYTVHALLC